MSIIALVLGFSSVANATLYLPEFRETRSHVAPEKRAFEKESIKSFRVLVFPHVGTYTIPQGRESDVSSVTINAQTGCDTFLATLGADQEWQKVEPKLSTVTQVKIDAKKAAPTFYECKGSFQVQRAAPLKSYSYAGNFVSIPDGKMVKIVNIVDPETYLKGVIPSEVVSSWPLEVLRAQAIAARTYGWWTVLDSRNFAAQEYDLDDTVAAQAYLGSTVQSLNTDAATDQTANKIMTFNNQVIKAYFSADSAGYTESALNGFGSDLPYCKAKQELYNPATVTINWNKGGALADLKTTLAVQNLIPAKITLKNVSVLPSDRTESGRVKKVTLLATDGKTYAVSGFDFRLATKLKSTLFDAQVNGALYALSGKGYGHGVGMAQDGALAYVQQMNWTAEQILNFYYSDVVITND